jgi:hypothetical protein
MSERKADQQTHPDDPIGELKIAGPQPDDPPEQFGDLFADRTTVTAYFEWQYTYEDTIGTVYIDGGGLLWQAEARKESDGWRIWSLDVPPWCGVEGQSKSGYARCTR